MRSLLLPILCVLGAPMLLRCHPSEGAQEDASAPADAADVLDGTDTGESDIGAGDANAVELDESAAGLTIVSDQGTTVSTQTMLDLHIAVDDGATVPASVEWSVEQPHGSRGRFLMGAVGMATNFEVNVVGTYRFTALARDAHGDVLATLLLLVVATPGPGLHIELTWRTPGDIDESDTGGDQIYFSVGSDVDLHLRYVKADDYFDWSYDCYWDNVMPEWGIFGPADNPALDRDDTDGAGPEIITLAEPEADVPYAVGVHYWNDWGYGSAFSTIRIYRDGVLQDEWADVELINDDLWETHTIEDGVVSRIGSEPRIIPSFRRFNGDFAIESDPGSVVAPGTTLTLRLPGVASIAPTATVDWSLTPPEGSLAAMTPGPDAFDAFEASFTADVVGAYGVTAVVRFDGGRAPTLSHGVMVTDHPNLRVELVWETPGDPDESDGGGYKGNAPGSDLDLHLLHPKADDFFAWAYDCYGSSPTPEWGIFSPFDNPTHAGDDFDGAGPETITLPAPEAATPYTVGVHYWHDSGGFGSAFATVRVYIDDVLQDEWAGVELVADDLWRSHTIEDGVVSRIGQTPLITPRFRASQPADTP